MSSNSQSKTEARLDLAEELANLAEALRDPATGEEMLEEMEEGGVLKLFSVLGKNKTIIVLKKWSDEEIADLKQKEEEQWADIIYDD